MPLERVGDIPGWRYKMCKDEGHVPPLNLQLEPGIYVWTCASCDMKTRFAFDGIHNYDCVVLPAPTAIPSQWRR